MYFLNPVINFDKRLSVCPDDLQVGCQVFFLNNVEYMSVPVILIRKSIYGDFMRVWGGGMLAASRYLMLTFGSVPLDPPKNT